jgi:hypothetical protein
MVEICHHFSRRVPLDLSYYSVTKRAIAVAEIEITSATTDKRVYKSNAHHNQPTPLFRIAPCLEQIVGDRGSLAFAAM